MRRLPSKTRSPTWATRPTEEIRIDSHREIDLAADPAGERAAHAIELRRGRAALAETTSPRRRPAASSARRSYSSRIAAEIARCGAGRSGSGRKCASSGLTRRAAQRAAGAPRGARRPGRSGSTSTSRERRHAFASASIEAVELAARTASTRSGFLREPEERLGVADARRIVGRPCSSAPARRVGRRRLDALTNSSTRRARSVSVTCSRQQLAGEPDRHLGGLGRAAPRGRWRASCSTALLGVAADALGDGVRVGEEPLALVLGLRAHRRADALDLAIERSRCARCTRRGAARPRRVRAARSRCRTRCRGGARP